MFETIFGEPKRAPDYLSPKASGIVIGVSLLLLICAVIGLIWDRYAYRQVAASGDTGQVTMVTHTWGFVGFWHPETIVQTDVGTFHVDGIFQAAEGQRVRIERRTNGSRALCDTETGQCNKLSRVE